MKKLLLFVLISLLILAGCTQGTPTAAPTDVATPAPTNRVIAEAEVEPVHWSELGFEESGTVAELLVAEGEVVKAGDLLVRLDPADANLAVQKAEAELSAAQARLDQAEAGTRAEQLAVDEAELKARQAELSQATARRDELQAGQLQADIVQAEAEFTEADVAAWSAEDIYEAFGYRLQDEARNKLIAARAARAAAEAQLTTAQQSVETQLHIAETGIWSAAAERQVAQAELSLAQAGSTAEQLTVAQADVARAEAALAAAREKLARTQLRAPFAGTVTKLDVEVGETVAPGTAVAVVATLDALQLVTTDLTELDVVYVAVDKPVEISVDALPGESWQGHVVQIDLQAVDNRGDVTYPVTIALDEAAPELRWGMTALITIEKEND